MEQHVKKFLALCVMMMSVFSYVTFAQEADQGDGKDAKPPPPPPADGQNRQGGGPRNFDPAKIQQMMLDRIKQNLGMTDEEWNAVKPLAEKVFTLTRESRSQAGMGQRRRPGQEGEDKAADQQPTTEIGKASQALQKLLENDKSAPEEIKTALQALRDAKKKSSDELVKAKAALVEKLTPRQEAKLVLMGILE